MDEKTAYWASVTLGAASLLLLVIYMSLVNNNQKLADEIGQRKATIDSSVTFDQIDRGMVQALAEIATKNNDAEARSLLAAQGITIAPPAAKSDESAKDAKDSKATKKKTDE